MPAWISLAAVSVVHVKICDYDLVIKYCGKEEEISPLFHNIFIISLT